MRSTAPATHGVVVQEGPQALWNGEHPLARGKWRQDVIDQMGGGLDHAASVTGRTHAAALATERYQKVVATAGAADASEARARRDVPCIPDGESGPGA